MRLIRFLWLLSFAALTSVAAAQSTDKWVVSWAGSVQGPYPVGQPVGATRSDARVPVAPRPARATSRSA